MFNYKKAWKEAAAPAFMALPPNILQLVWRVHEEAQHIKHDRKLDLQWPDKSLRDDFNNIPCEELSYAAHIVLNAGHWHPGYDDWLRPISRRETHWRFSLYADQVLRESLGVKRHSTPNGHIYEIVDGLLRSTVGRLKQGYYSTPIGLATKENLDLARKILDDNWNKDDSFSNIKRCIQLQKEACFDKRIIDQNRFME